MTFSNIDYKNQALNLRRSEKTHSPAEAFSLLIRCSSDSNLKPTDLENLCKKLQEFYSYSFENPEELTLEECFTLIQKADLPEEEKNIILNLAYECLANGTHLGNNTILDGKINTSSWISHSLFMGQLCGCLASALNLDVDKAVTYGLLHDFGRKYVHSFDHATIGFEKLCDLNWTDEAIGCLTHSFVDGGRCSNNEQAIDGFYVDENGNAKWQEGTEKDDITLFLENYEYDEYDMILNIADLMATDKGIVSPYERIADIATRRTIDPTNRAYFLTELTNMLINFLNKINCNDSNFKFIKATKDISLEEIDNYFKKVSDHFFNVYLQLEQNYKYNNQNKK